MCLENGLLMNIISRFFDSRYFSDAVLPWQDCGQSYFSRCVLKPGQLLGNLLAQSLATCEWCDTELFSTRATVLVVKRRHQKASSDGLDAQTLGVSLPPTW